MRARFGNGCGGEILQNGRSVSRMNGPDDCLSVLCLAQAKRRGVSMVSISQEELMRPQLLIQMLDEIW